VTAIALAPEPTSSGNPRRSNPPTPPSFEIRGAVGVPLSSPRWDRINSADVIARSRRIYYTYLENSGGGADPLGIVITGAGGGQGRVVFENPVLLPDEQFIPIELVRGRNGRGRGSRPLPRG
jgi:hypothetical protein